MRDLLKPAIRSLRLLSRRQKFVFFLFMAARIVTNLLDVAGLAGVALFGSMVASGLASETEYNFAIFSISLRDSTAYLWVITMVVVLFLTKSLVATLLLRANYFFLAKVEAQASSEILEFVFGGDLGRVKQYSPAQIQWSVSTSATMAFSIILTNFSVLITEMSLFLFVFVAFAIIDLQTALLITSYFLILIGLFHLVVNRRLVEAGHRLEESSKGVTRVVLDLSRAFRELVVLSRARTFLDDFRNLRRLEARTLARVRFFDGSPRFVIESALMLGVMALVGWQFLRGNLSEGLTITAAFMAGGVRMMSALLPLQNAVSWLRVNGPQARDAQEDLEKSRKVSGGAGPRLYYSPILEPGLTSDSGGRSQKTQPLSVQLSGVSYRYPGADTPAIRDISLEIKPGSIVALVGPSGAGKTTIVDLILGLLNPNEGTVYVGGKSPQLVRRDLPGAVSYVPQKPGMVTGSVAQNVALGISPDKISFPRVENVLGAVGLLKELGSREGALSDLGAHADGLSGGQLQRIGLARALYSSPQLIVLDEATSALDAGSEAEIVRYVESLRGSVTVVIIAHRLSTIQRSDRVFAVEGGKLVGSGTFSEVRRQVPLIEEYVQLMTFDELD